MGTAHFAVFLGVAAAVILLPGPDTAVVTRNALLHGRRAGLGTSAGVNAGLSIWTLAAALGLASVVKASAIAFDTLKLIGAGYLIWLGVQALRAAHRAADATAAAGGANHTEHRLGAAGGFRQGMASNLANPKVAVFFTSLLPQFVAPGHASLLPFAVLGAVFLVMNIAWLSGYALIASRLAATLTRPRVKATMDRITGAILIAVGLRLAAEHR